MAMRWTLATLAGLAIALSGCSGVPAAGEAPLTPTGMTILGLVQNETFAPIPGAQVTLRLTNLTATTDVGGLFSFRDLALSPYIVDVAAPGFANATLAAEPRNNVSLSFVLYAAVQEAPPPVVLHFTGKFDCAFEAVIISPSCDTLVDLVGDSAPPTPAGSPNLFEDISTFDVGLNPQWSTAVVDVDFDAHAGLDGLRVTVQGRNDADQLAAYEKYGQFHSPDPFSFRLEPGQEYPEGDRAVPANATVLQLEVYPQGHGWHAGGVSPFLGVGAAQAVQFDVYVTVFFVDPAPDGYTLLP